MSKLLYNYVLSAQNLQKYESIHTKKFYRTIFKHPASLRKAQAVREAKERLDLQTKLKNNPPESLENPGN